MFDVDNHLDWKSVSNRSISVSLCCLRYVIHWDTDTLTIRYSNRWMNATMQLYYKLKPSSTPRYSLDFVNYVNKVIKQFFIEWIFFSPVRKITRTYELSKCDARKINCSRMRCLLDFLIIYTATPPLRVCVCVCLSHHKTHTHILDWNSLKKQQQPLLWHTIFELKRLWANSIHS